MFAPVDTRKPHEVEGQVRSIYQALFPRGDAAFVTRVFGWVNDCFTGRYPGYQAIDARYHDFEHTLQGTLCLARLLHGRHAAKAKPEVGQPAFELALLAILLHDTGYLKKQGDTEGTGAKYTLIHVDRSADFAREFLLARGCGAPDAESAQNMIRCTGIDADLRAIPFRDELEGILGCALGTADLLGQMAAPDYVEKLPTLYEEFAEAVRHDGPAAARFAVYRNAQELVRNTPSFWENYVLPKINDDFRELYVFLNDPYPSGPNPYLQAIQRNLARIREAEDRQP
jgi:hypothetical protein